MEVYILFVLFCFVNAYEVDITKQFSALQPYIQCNIYSAINADIDLEYPNHMIFGMNYNHNDIDLITITQLPWDDMTKSGKCIDILESITFIPLQKESTPINRYGMEENTRLPERYRNNVYCYPNQNTETDNDSRDVLTYSVRIIFDYIKNQMTKPDMDAQWYCKVKPNRDSDMPFKHAHSTGFKVFNDEIHQSIPPSSILNIDMTRYDGTSTENDSMIGLTCTTSEDFKREFMYIGQHLDKEVDGTLTVHPTFKFPILDISLTFNIHENSKYEKGVAKVSSDIFSRNNMPDTHDPNPFITGLLAPKLYDEHCETRSEGLETDRIFQQAVQFPIERPTLDPLVYKLPRTVSMNGRRFHDNGVVLNPFTNARVNTDFVSFVDKTFINSIPTFYTEKHHNSNLYDKALIYDGNIFDLIPNDLPERDPEAFAEIKRTKIVKIIESDLRNEKNGAYITSGLRKVLVKIPEQDAIKPVRTQEFGVKFRNDQYIIPYLIPSRELYRDLIHAVGTLRLEYRDISVLYIGADYPNSHKVKVRGCKPSKNNVARLVFIANGASVHTGMHLSHSSVSTRCTAKKDSDRHADENIDGVGDWKVYTRDMIFDRDFELWTSPNINGTQPPAGMAHHWMAFCGRNNIRGRKMGFKKELILTEPMKPSHPEKNVIILNDDLIFTTSQCIYGTQFEGTNREEMNTLQKKLHAIPNIFTTNNPVFKFYTYHVIHMLEDVILDKFKERDGSMDRQYLRRSFERCISSFYNNDYPTWLEAMNGTTTMNIGVHNEVTSPSRPILSNCEESFKYGLWEDNIRPNALGITYVNGKYFNEVTKNVNHVSTVHCSFRGMRSRQLNPQVLSIRHIMFGKGAKEAFTKKAENYSYNVTNPYFAMAVQNMYKFDFAKSVFGFKKLFNDSIVYSCKRIFADSIVYPHMYFTMKLWKKNSDNMETGDMQIIAYRVQSSQYVLSYRYYNFSNNPSLSPHVDAQYDWTQFYIQGQRSENIDYNHPVQIYFDDEKSNVENSAGMISFSVQFPNGSDSYVSGQCLHEIPMLFASDKVNKLDELIKNDTYHCDPNDYVIKTKLLDYKSASCMAEYKPRRLYDYLEYCAKFSLVMYVNKKDRWPNSIHCDKSTSSLRSYWSELLNGFGGSISHFQTDETLTDGGTYCNHRPNYLEIVNLLQPSMTNEHAIKYEYSCGIVYENDETKFIIKTDPKSYSPLEVDEDSDDCYEPHDVIKPITRVDNHLSDTGHLNISCYIPEYIKICVNHLSKMNIVLYVKGLFQDNRILLTTLTKDADGYRTLGCTITENLGVRCFFDGTMGKASLPPSLKMTPKPAMDNPVLRAQIDLSYLIYQASIVHNSNFKNSRTEYSIQCTMKNLDDIDDDEAIAMVEVSNTVNNVIHPKIVSVHNMGSFAPDTTTLSPLKPSSSSISSPKLFVGIISGVFFIILIIVLVVFLKKKKKKMYRKVDVTAQQNECVNNNYYSKKAQSSPIYDVAESPDGGYLIPESIPPPLPPPLIHQQTIATIENDNSDYMEMNSPITNRKDEEFNL